MLMKKLTLALSFAIAVIAFSESAMAEWSAKFEVQYVVIPQNGLVQIYTLTTTNPCGSGWYDLSSAITEANIQNRMASTAVAAKLAARQLSLNTVSCNG